MNEQRPDEKEMIDGIVDMLNQVEDINNRKQMALDRLRDFKKEGIKVNEKEFLKRCGLDSVNEKWTQKYKRSIDCNNPKGFSQKAHCQGRKKNEMTNEQKLNLFLEKNCPTSPEKWAASKAAAKSKFDVYPSAYANGWAAKNYKSKGGGWKSCKESIELNEACWDGYKQVGMKEKNGKMVPNCVPIKENNMKLKEDSVSDVQKRNAEQHDDVTDNPYRRDKDSEINYGKKQPEEILEYDVENGEVLNEDLNALSLLIPALALPIGVGLSQLIPFFGGHDNIYSQIKDWWNSKKDNAAINKIANRIKNDPEVQEFIKKKNKRGWKEMLKKKLTDSELNYINQIYRSRFNKSEINYGKKQPEEILEYDVENGQDMKEFVKFMREYTQYLAEANCPCVYEAEYQGRTVKLGKPMAGDVKKFKVYVKNDKGNVVKVNFGQKGVKIKKNNPGRRANFRARHNCDSPGPRWRARYWSCRAW